MKYGEQAPFYAKLMQVGRARGVVVYTFAPRDVDWAHRVVWGRTYSPKLGGWVRRPYPLPGAVFNRYPAAAYNQHVLSTIRRLKDRGSPFVNSSFQDKYRLHRTLMRWPALRPHLPQSRLCRGSAAPVLELLRTYSSVYMKPVDGSLGSGVVRIRRLGGGRCHVAGRLKGGRISRIVPAASLAAVVRRIAGSRRYMAQQGLTLDYLRGRTADIRALVQRDGRGVWQITGMALRVGASGSVTSNLHGGGRAVPVERALASHFGPARTRQIMVEVKRVLGLFVAAMEQSLGPMGELGMDLGVDAKGHVWYIESNPKPGRSILLHLHATRQRALSISRPIDYAIYLARRGHNHNLPPPDFLGTGDDLPELGEPAQDADAAPAPAEQAPEPSPPQQPVEPVAEESKEVAL